MEIKTIGLTEAIREGMARKARAEKLEPALTKAARELKTFMTDRFATRTDPSGQPWIPVTINTEFYRETDGLGLARSRFAFVGIGRTLYGAKASFADVHQHGDGRVPQRRFAPMEGDTGPAAELISKIKGDLTAFVLDGKLEE